MRILPLLIFCALVIYICSWFIYPAGTTGAVVCSYTGQVVYPKSEAR